jgi:Na+/melibiose symporter-like transporter
MSSVIHFLRERYMSTNKQTRRLTSVITGLTFALVSVTGILLFFHIKSVTIINLHEWIGIGFLLAAALHLVINWKAFASYLSHRAFWVGLLGVVLACALVLAMPDDGRKKGHGRYGSSNKSITQR